MDVRSSRGGIVIEIFLALATALALLATFATAKEAVARFDQDPTFATLVLLPAIVALVFGGLLAAAIAGRRSRAAFDTLRSLHPEEPWRWEPGRWKDGRLRDSERVPLAIGMVVSAALWNLVAGGAAFATFEQGAWSQKPHIAVMSVVFIAVGLGLVAAAGYFVAAARKFPASTFQMDAVPGVLGGTLSGTVLVPEQVADGVEATISLDCTSLTRGSGRNSSISRCLWKDEARRPASGGAVPVAFTIPFDLWPTDPLEDADRTTIHWHLRVEVALPGVDYRARFEVPVFRTRASDRTIAAGVVTVDAGAAEVGAEPPPNPKAKIETTEGATTITYPEATGIGCGVISLVLALIAAAMIARSVDAEFHVVLGWASAVLAAGGAVAALMAFGVLTTVVRAEIDASEVRLFYGKPPLARCRTVALTDVRQVRYASSGQMANPRVELVRTDGSVVVLGERLSSLDEAKWLTAELTRLLGARTSAK